MIRKMKINKNIEDIYKKYNEKIMPSEKMDNRILNNTIYKRRYNSYFKYSLIVVCALLIVSITSLSIAYADELKYFVEKYFIKTIKTSSTNSPFKNNDFNFFVVTALKNVNYDAELPEVDGQRIRFEDKPIIKMNELEEKLQTQFLHFNGNQNQDVMIIGLEKVNNKIGSGDFDISLKTDNKKTVGITMSFITEYTELYKEGFPIEFNTMHDSSITLTEHSEKLNTDIYYIVGTTNKENYETRETYNQAMFVYDDVRYFIHGNRITKNLISELIETSF